jgi:Tfp pilus assembly protein PilE
MVELAISMTVLLILTAIAIPSLMRSIRTYQLNSAAARVSDMLKFTRFEAVRRNKQINFLTQASADGWIVGTDSDNNGTVDATEKQQLIAGFAVLLPSGVAPSPTAISTALGGASLTTKSGSNSSVTFDARGAISVTERVGVIARVRALAVGIAKAWVDQQRGELPAKSKPEPIGAE